jgi:hypothetical protein
MGVTTGDEEEEGGGIFVDDDTIEDVDEGEDEELLVDAGSDIGVVFKTVEVLFEDTKI